MIMYFLFFLPGFSIKAVPFPNAILNVKELGGKDHVPSLSLCSFVCIQLSIYLRVELYEITFS